MHGNDLNERNMVAMPAVELPVRRLDLGVRDIRMIVSGENMPVRASAFVLVGHREMEVHAGPQNKGKKVGSGDEGPEVFSRKRGHRNAK
jgi:hypothetical protein